MVWSVTRWGRIKEDIRSLDASGLSLQSDVESATTNELSGDDEEIDEDAAFTQDDWKKYGDWFEGEDGSDVGTDDEGVDDASDDAQESPAEDGHEGSSDESQEDEEASDEDDYGAGDHDELLKRVAGLQERQSRRPAVVNEAVGEDEHHVVAPQEDGAGLQLEDLLNATELDSVARKQLQKLVAKPQVVGARLPKAIQQRQERKAAYVSSSKEASQWMPLVQANRQAPTLRLTSGDATTTITTAAGLASKHTPVSDFEQEIADMLKAAGHCDTASAAKVDEAIGSTRLSPEEWQKRQDAMAKNSALLFYQEHKAKRLKKIKSKAYHRHMKKKAAKAMPADDEASQQARAEEDEFRRAQERLTLKHRNTSRWARRALKRGLSLANDSEREALQEQLRLSRELRAKAARARDGSESDGSTDVSTDDEAGGDAQLSTKDKAELMQAMQQGQLAGMEDALPRKGLFAMPFMRRAIAKQQQDVALEAQDILAAQQLVESLPAGENGDSHQGHSGRIVLAGPAAEGRRAARKGLRVPEEEGGEEEDATAHTVRVRAAAAVQERSTAAGGGPATRRAVVKASAAGKAIKPGGPRQAAHVSVVGQSGEHASAEVRGQEAGHGTSAEDEAAAVAEAKRGSAGDAMQDALQAAFAGDDVVAEFERDKAEAAKESTEAVEDPSALPGWGAWAKGREPKWLTMKKAKAEKEKKSRLAKRADAKLANVIICEKYDKKAAKFTVPELPFPYTQQEAYERRMRVPLGRDSNTEASFRDLTRPAVIKQAGQIIQPLQRSRAALEASAAKKRGRANVVVVAGGTVKRNRKH